MSKTKSRSTLLLKIVSVLFIVYGIYFIVASILSLVGETIVISGMGYLAAGAGWVCAVLEFAAGYFGFKCKNKTLCGILGLIILALAIVTLFTTIMNGPTVWTVISGVIPVALPALYIYGVSKSA
jgi:hypothetical protein